MKDEEMVESLSGGTDFPRSEYICTVEELSREPDNGNGQEKKISEFYFEHGQIDIWRNVNKIKII